MIRRNLAAVLLGFFALALAQITFAQDAFPSKPIHIIVPYPPGGAADSLPRLIGEHIETTTRLAPSSPISSLL